MVKYKVILNGGDMNGGVRYYTALSTARRIAKSYCTRCSKKFGLCDNSYAEIYLIDEKYKSHLIESIG